MKKTVQNYQDAYAAYEADRSQENSDKLQEANKALLALDLSKYPDETEEAPAADAEEGKSAEEATA